MHGPLDGKTAIVTGASSGIGAATVRALRAAGAKVAGGARRKDRIDADYAAELDVRDPASCTRFVTAAVETLGGLDILVNAAGVAFGRDVFPETTDDDARVVLETNVNGLIRMTRLALPHIRASGHIVMIGSVSGRQAYANDAVYIASKFAVRGFVYTLREDLLGRPIGLTTVDPGAVSTEFSVNRFRGDIEKGRAAHEGLDAITPDELADCILFALTRPPHVVIDELVVKPLQQSNSGRLLRRP